MLKSKADFNIYIDVYNSYYALIYNIVSRKVNSEADCEDICQDVFMRFYEKYSEVENPRNWLLGTVRRVILEFYKRKERNNVDIAEAFDDVALSFVNGFKDTRVIIEQAIDKIREFSNEQDRVLFDLIAVNNYSYQGAANELGLTKRKVQYKYRKLVDSLLLYLESKGIKSFEELL